MTTVTNLESILRKWKFPNNIIEKYQTLGILNIFEWQSECLHIDSVLDGGNLVYAAPTSAGKTLVSELLMIRSILNRRRKAIFILPYVSIAKEKLKHFQYILSDSDIFVDGFIGGQSPKGGFESIDIAICTIEKSNSLLNRLIENDAVFELGLIVVDELHMVNDNSRGYLIELVLSKIKYLCYKSNKSNQKIQIIGMSATLPNLKKLSGWLDATLYETNFRPIQLNEYLKFESSIYDKHMQLISKIEIDSRIENDNDLLANLVLNTIKQKNGVLVFCPTKSRCEVIAENIAKTIYTLDRSYGEMPTYLNKDRIIDCLNELKATPAGLDSQLNRTVRYGIGFHHAGLTIEEREIIENYFKNGHLLVIVCTSTLSSGVNFPAHRVIIRTPISNGNKPLDIITYKQMVGRAARNSNGDSILMCSNQNEKKIAIELLNSEIGYHNSTTKINNNNNNSNKPGIEDNLLTSVKRALLEIIVSGIATKKDDIINYFECFLSDKLDEDEINKNSHQKYEFYLSWLNKSQFIDIIKTEHNIECYKATQLGYAVVAAAMAPDEGLIIFNELQKALQCFVLENELHIIYQITPINISDYWINSSCNIDWNLYYSLYQNFKPDVKRVGDLVGVRQSFILKMMKSNMNCDQKLLKIHLRFFTALILNDLVNEVPFSTILNKYSCQKGFLQSLQQSSSSYAHMISTFCNRLSWFNLEILISQFHARLIFGVQKQLVDLVRISLLNSQRARAFYNAGYTTVASLAMCDLKIIEKILRSSMMFVGSSGGGDKQQSNEQFDKINVESCIWSNGKSYTYYEASNSILQKANDILKSDLEQLGIKIKSEQLDTTNMTNKTTTNKSMFDFNESINVDSIIQVHSKNVTGLEMEINKEDSNNISFENNEKNDLMLLNNVQSNSKIIQDIQQNSAEISHSKTNIETKFNNLFGKDDESNQSTNNNDNSYNKSIGKGNTISNEELIKLADLFNNEDDDADEESEFNEPYRVTEANDQIKNIQEANSFLDDQFILQAATSFENNKQKLANNAIIDTNLTNSNKKLVNFNTTIVSEDVLQLCNIFEKNVLSAQKGNNFNLNRKENTPKNENHVHHYNNKNINKINKKLNYSFSEQTLIDILNSSLNTTQANNTEKKTESNDLKLKIKTFINHDLSCSLNPNLNIIETLNEYELFSNSLKPKSTLSISIACDYLNEKTKCNNCDDLYEYIDQTNGEFIKFYGLAIYVELPENKQNDAYFLLFNQNEIFKTFIKNIFEREDLIKIMFFTKSHYKLLNKVFGICAKMPLYDPITSNWLINQEICTIYQLKQKYCSNVNLIIDNELKQSKFCYGCSNISYKSHNSSLNVYQRAFIESLVGLYCFDKIKLQLQLNNLWNYYIKIEAEILIICANCEINGFCLDSDELDSIKNKLINTKRDIETKINSIVGYEVNLNSTEQVASIIYDKLKLKPLADQSKMNSKKFSHHSTSKDILNQLGNQHEVPRMIILWRKIAHTLSKSIYPVERYKVFEKSLNTYKIFSKIDLFNVTGRMNFIEPSMQNIPRDFEISIETGAIDNLNLNQFDIANHDIMMTDEEFEFICDKLIDDQINSKSTNFISIRNAFVANKNKILLSADYSNLEFRIMANLCKDELLISVFNDKKITDVFVSLAGKWLNLPENQIDDEKRQNVKKIIYAIIYGISPKALSILLSLPEKEAFNFIESFKSTFPGLKKFIKSQLDLCQQKGYVETIRKRRRFFPNICSEDPKLRAQAERQAINTLVQGSASDLVKSAMVKIDKTLSKKFKTKSGDTYIPARLVLQMHDELIYEVNEVYLKEVQNIVKDCMENCMDLPVKMKVKLKTGKSWGSLATIS